MTQFLFQVAEMGFHTFAFCSGIFLASQSFPGFRNRQLKIKHLSECFVATLPLELRLRRFEPIPALPVSAFNLYANLSPIEGSGGILRPELGLVSEINEAPITSNYGNKPTYYGGQHTGTARAAHQWEEERICERLGYWLSIKMYCLAAICIFTICHLRSESFISYVQSFLC